MAAKNPAQDGAPNLFAASRVKRGLVRAPIPALMLLGTALLYLLLADTEPAYFLFFLPVAFAGVGLGARAGVLAAVAAIAVVIVRSLLVERAYLTGELDVAIIDMSPYILWATFLVVTGYIVGLISQRGGSRGVGIDLGTEIMRAVEREHMRIGHDLHDTVAQNAAGSLMEAEILSSMLDEASPDVRGQAQRVTNSLNACIDELRGAITNLRPPALAQPEFLDSLRRLVEAFTTRTGKKVEFSVEGHPERHSDSVRICVYRVIQEALGNIEHHAQASRVYVSVRASRRTVYLLVADDGVGFDPQPYDGDESNGHFGLKGMQERVALLGGELEIETAPRTGTGVRARIPAL